MLLNSRTRWRLAAWIVVPSLLLLLYPLQVRIDERKTVEQEKEELLLRSGNLLRKLSLGYEGLFANIYWTRVVQYYGGKLHEYDPKYELLSPLLDITTTLDPKLIVAYRFGATFLAEPSPVGAGRPEDAAPLLRKGIAANPDDWILWADLGFLYYWHLRDYEAASAAYLEGSKHPKAGLWMKGMAAKIAEEGGSRETSRILWAQIHESTENATMRKNALEHISALKADEDIEQLDKLLAAYEVRTGRAASSLRELVRAGFLRGIPVDPSGVEYEVGEDGRAQLGKESAIRLEILKPAQRRPDEQLP